MSRDEYIAIKERQIKALKNGINHLDEKLGLNDHSEVSKIKVNTSQLPFEVNDFDDDKDKAVVEGHLLEEYLESKGKGRKVIPMPGLESSFCYDFQKNEWWTKGPMHLIWGWEDQCNGNFKEVLKLVVKNDKQQFEDTVFASIGKENHVITKPILLKNGNQIVEEYNFLYHDGDYEYRSPLLLQGHTKLIAINK